MIKLKDLKFRLFSLVALYFLLISCSVNKSKILIIGDSISIGYTPFVQEKLAKKAVILHNPGNAQHTGTGLNKVADWIGNDDYDIIQFNWGLWDLCYRSPDSKLYGNRDKINGKITYEIDEYAANLDAIVKLLKAKSDAKLVFVTTTHVPAYEAGRFKEDPIRYNEAAKQIMNENQVIVNDIYPQSVKIHKSFGKDSSDVHYTEQGYKELGKKVAKFLKKNMRQF